MRIDLHTHSFVSDGTDSPASLVAAARAAGLDVVALTDHDTTAGWDEASENLPANLALVPGVEISCRHQGVSLHLLAYLFDRGDAPLGAELELARTSRVGRAQEIVRRLAEEGYDVSWPQVLAQVADGATVGRPHIADALVATGVVGSRDEAFAELLHNGSRFYVAHYALDPVHAVRLVTAAGGVAVFAHPAAGMRGRTVDDDVIADMAAAGLAGLEVDHRDQDEPARAHLRGLAGELGLLVTGSSDYHGAGKANRLGENTTSPEVFEELLVAATGASVIRGAAS